MINEYKLQPDVTIRFSNEEIEFRKGVFNFFYLSVKKNSELTTQEFSDLYEYLIKLSNKEKIQFDNSDNLFKIFKELEKYQIISKISDNFIIDYLIINNEIPKSTLEKFNIFEKSKILKFNEIEKTTFSKNKNFVILIELFNFEKINSLNKSLIKINSKVIYLFKDNNFLHSLYVDNNYTGCFECFSLRSLSRAQSFEITKENLNSLINVSLDDNKLFFLLSLISLIIENSNKFKSILLESKIFSIYLPTFEIHIDKLLKMSNCTSCGYYSKQESYELNISLKEAVKELLKDE